jgi:hypothetical protein
MIKVTVDRGRWLRGVGSETSMLLRESDGRMCCLGFVALALGKTEDQIRGYAAPGSPVRDNRGVKVGFGTVLLDLCPKGHLSEPAPIAQAMEENDDTSISDEIREERLIPLLAEVGIELEFVDGPVRS